MSHDRRASRQESTRESAGIGPSTVAGTVGALPLVDHAPYRPGRTLPVRVELVRQLRRRRTQVAFAVAGVLTAGSQPVATSAGLFDALNLADTIKLVLLAAFAASVTTAATRAGMTGRWTRWLTLALVAALPIGGIAFIVDSTALTAVLYASLPLLLVWVATFSWQIGRRAR